MVARTEAVERLRKPLSSGGLFEPSTEILRFDPERMWRIAETITDTSLKVEEGDRLLVQFSPCSRQLAAMIGYQAAARGAIVSARGVDQTVEASMLAGMAEHPTPECFNEMAFGRSADVAWSTKVAIVLYDDDPSVMDVVPGQIAKEWRTALSPSVRTRTERRQWVAILLPTPAEAAMDQMSFPDYVDMFLRACDRPWDKIKAAQQILIDEYLNPGKYLEIFAGKKGKWQTHLTMSIEGQTFANSTVDRNVPGSEAFSSPVRGTTEGRLGLPYPVMFCGKVLPNLRLEFEKGKAIDHFTTSKKDLNWIEQQLNIDEGAREVGEIAFATNRVFDRPLLNRMFVEKVGGSGHVARGAAYQFREYGGIPVKVDNGVRSADHEDLTFMMLPQFGGGKVIVDGITIQKNGDFLDPRLAILNSV